MVVNCSYLYNSRNKKYVIQWDCEGKHEIWDQECAKQKSATKLVKTDFALKGLSDVLLTSKGEDNNLCRYSSYL